MSPGMRIRSSLPGHLGGGIVFPARLNGLARFLGILAVLALSAMSNAQTTWYVDDDNCPGPGDGSLGNPFCLIQDAVDATGDGDVVVINPGTYMEMVIIDLRTVPRSMTIRSIAPENPAVSATTILSTPGTFLWTIEGPTTGPTPTVTIEGLTFRGGVNLGLQTIYVNCVLRNCSFLGNSRILVDFLGDIVPITFLVQNCTFIKNTGPGLSAAIEFRPGPGSACIIEDSLFIGNSAGSHGGAIAGYGGGESAKISRCTFLQNTAGSDDGGAIFWQSADLFVLEDCHFCVNSAVGNGGAVALMGSVNSAIIRGNTFEGNDAGLFGGGIYLEGTHNDTLITGNRFDGNFATQGGGGIEFLLTGASYGDNRFCYNLPLDVAGTFNDLGGNRTACGGQVSFNENCTSASEILVGATPFTTTGTSDIGPDLDISCDEGHGVSVMSDIWFRYFASTTGTLTVSTCDDADFDTRLAAYTGPCAAPTLVACNDEGAGCLNGTSLMDVSVTAGVTYLIRVGSSSGAQGAGTLTLSLAACLPDINGDGNVNVTDLLALLAAWGVCP